MAKAKDEGIIKAAKPKDDVLEARIAALQKVVDALLGIPAEDRGPVLELAQQMVGAAPAHPNHAPVTISGPRPFGAPAR